MSQLFTIYDYLVLILILVISLFIGLYFGIKSNNKVSNNDIELVSNHEKNNNTQVSEYLTANSSIGPLPIAFSLFASFYSATSLLGMVIILIFTYSFEQT